MIDAHCHLQFQAFSNDYDKVIKDAFKKNITHIINAGTQVSSSHQASKLTSVYPQLFAVIGIHPHHADKVSPGWISDLKEIAVHNSKIIGIGECGLDYYKYQSNGMVDPGLQEKVFIEQIELASELKLPLQIHTRGEKAREKAIEILIAHKRLLQTVPGMFHCIAGTREVVRRILDLGFFVGFDGNLTYPGLPPGESESLSELASFIPLDRIVVETDSPYLTPIPRRGQRNEPGYVIITAECLAEIKGISFDEVVEETDRNVYTIFTQIKSNI